jgi:outer membrane protein assembly factor BamA
MTKFRLQISVLVFLLCFLSVHAQDKYRLYIHCVDKDSVFLASQLGIKTGFASRFDCMNYVNQLPGQLQAKGYITLSVDSLQYDSLSARMVLFVGEPYHWVQLDAKAIDATVLSSVGWREKNFENKPIDFIQVAEWEDKILKYFENTGYPFAKVYLDSVQLENDKVTALLKVNKGPQYKIDSIRLFGNAKISNKYLQQYLDIPNGSIYNKEKLLRIGKKIKDLPYVEEEKPSNITLLPTGSIVNLYLKPRRSSQVNLLIGFLPNNDQLSSKKMLITGEGNINLKNALGAGETIGLNFQALQVQSQRLNMFYQHPYFLHSPVGLDFSFDMFRKDSSFVNVNFQLGAQYILSATQSGKLFIQHFQTLVSNVNTAYVLQNRKLPDEADVNAINVGVDYEINTTDYRRNPRSGNEFHIIVAAGSKKIKKNNEILQLKDPSDPAFNFDKLYDTVKLNSYLFRFRGTAAKYYPVGKQTVLKTALNAGWVQSGNIFRNELFQIGGFRLLRGFDEESQYLSQFAIATLEYRYLVGPNSFFYLLADGGWGRNNSQNISVNYSYFGTGLGLAFETKAGIFNLAWAVGKRNDTEFNLRQSKIHFGFINYF